MTQKPLDQQINEMAAGLRGEIVAARFLAQMAITAMMGREPNKKAALKFLDEQADKALNEMKIIGGDEHLDALTREIARQRLQEFMVDLKQRYEV